MKRFNKLLLSAVIALSAAMTMSSCSTDGVKDGFGGFVDSISGVIGEDAGNSLKEGFNGIADTIGGWFGAETGETEDDSGKETPAEKKVTVTFDANGGAIVESKEYIVGKEYTLPTTTKKGYTFEGWFNGETEVAETGTWSVETNVELTAKWTAKQYTLTLKYEDGATVDTTIPVTYDGDYSLPSNPERTDYVFAGWVKEDGAPFEKTATWTLDGNLTLKATWNVGVTFIFGNGIEALEIQDVKDGEAWDFTEKTSLLNPTRTGYTFEGWYLEDGTTEILLTGDSWAYGKVSISAKWTAKEYTVTVNKNDGSATYEQKISYDQKLDVEKPERAGYKFGGWIIEQSNEEFVSGEIWKGESDITIVAQWLKIYKIVYNTKNVGSDDVIIAGSEDEIAPTYDTEYVEGDSTIALIVIKDKTDNYSFNGWYVNGELKTHLDADFFANFEGDTVTVEAKWSGNWTKNY